MKTLKWFSLEWREKYQNILLSTSDGFGGIFFKTFDLEQQAFEWLENNGYIERTKDDSTPIS